MIEVDSLKKIYVRGSLLKYRHTAAEGVSFKGDGIHVQNRFWAELIGMPAIT